MLAAPYIGTDIDSGGRTDQVAADGKTLEQIVIETAGEKYPPRPDLPTDYKTWTREQDRANEEWCNKIYEMFRKIVAWR